ncbi:MAG: signal peptidase I [Proteobacteria bacterium]|nr:signal peptidase I [Pseudomonadota bacterium]
MTTNENPTTNSKSEAPLIKEQPGFFSYENIKSLLVLAVIIFAIRWSIASPYFVPTASMEPTIKVGDRLLAWKLAYELKIPFTDISAIRWADTKRGDIIVFKYPKDPEIDYVKRVVALGGDTVQVKDDILYINGKPQERVDHNSDRSILEDIHDSKEYKLLFKESFEGQPSHWVMQHKPEYRRFTNSFYPGIDNPPYVVPENSVFCMGDNRDNSSDSRVWGEVPKQYIRGKALFVIWSMWSPTGQTFPSFRFNRFGKWLDS